MSLKQYLKKNTPFLLTSIALLLWLIDPATAQNIPADSAIIVPLGGNGWLSKGAEAKIGDEGLSNWINKQDTISIYIRTEIAGSLQIALKLRATDGSATMRISVGKNVLSRTVASHETTVVDFGKIDIQKPGYIRIDLQGMSKSGKEFAQVSDLILKGTALSKGAAYVKITRAITFTGDIGGRLSI